MRLWAWMILAVMGCAASGPKHPWYGMRAVLHGSDGMTFEDERIVVEFTIKREQIAFALTNKTDKQLRIDWDSLSFIDMVGQSHRVIHNGTKFANGNQAQAPTVVPPRGKVTDSLLPADHVFWVPGYANQYGSSPGHWDASPLLGGEGKKFLVFAAGNYQPNSDVLEGQAFGIYFPMQFGDEKMDMTFTFETHGYCAKNCDQRSTAQAN